MELIPGLIDDIGLECLVKVPYHYFSSVNSVCQRWKLQMELPQFRQRRTEAGMTQHDSTRSGTWMELPPIHEYLDGLPMFCQLVGVGLNLVVMGGWNPVTWEVTNAVFVYNFVTAKWRQGDDIPGCWRSFFACASDFEQMVFVAGGHDDEKSALRSALAYDVAKDEWIPLPDMARERDECKGVFNNGKFHVIGGYHTNMQGRFENSAETFDVSNWRWDEVQEQFLETAMCPRTCVDGGDGRLYICHDSGIAAVDNCTFDNVAELPTDLRITSYVTGFKGKLLVIGSTGFNEQQRCWVLDLRTHKWTRIESVEGFTGHVQSGCCLEL
ncbi:hypothetical protein LIER_13885 [Lithospermum erythrorhizon]|uniref:F-box/kelch-repeat protein n=1 Tax=Lithospermum erythrorhizon TaxID=34254 RepID=A0AAV3PZ04_LITER